jgi:hypothetical protein
MQRVSIPHTHLAFVSGRTFSTKARTLAVAAVVSEGDSATSLINENKLATLGRGCPRSLLRVSFKPDKCDIRQRGAAAEDRIGPELNGHPE